MSTDQQNTSMLSVTNAGQWLLKRRVQYILVVVVFALIVSLLKLFRPQTYNLNSQRAPPGYRRRHATYAIEGGPVITRTNQGVVR